MIRAAIRRNLPAAAESAAFTLDVEFEAGPGITVLFGPSGSGKTLTLDAIAGFNRPDAGRILLDDRILFDGDARVHLPPRDRACGYVFQNHALFPHMTLRENLAFAAASLPRLERHRRIGEQLERFRLTDLAGRYPHQLSGGQRQRGAIARALLPAPRVVLLDEPGRGLDAAFRAELHGLVRELKASLALPILLVTHDAEECLALGDQVLVYEAGRIVHRAAPLELLRNPATETVARLLGGFNIYDAEVVALDPGRQSSRLLLNGAEIAGPHLRGCFRGDRIAVGIRPEELKAATHPGPNRIRTELRGTTERPQAVRAEFDDSLIVDIPREVWPELAEAGRTAGWWVEVPPQHLRQLGR